MPSPLNKTETRAEERREREAEAQVIGYLEAQFPFTVLQFDPEFFGLGANPSERISPEDLSSVE